MAVLQSLADLGQTVQPTAEPDAPTYQQESQVLVPVDTPVVTI